MKTLSLALLVFPISLWAQQEQRPATEEEKKILLPDETAARMQTTAESLGKKAQLSMLQQGMLGNALTRGLDDQQIKGYLQTLTDLGLTKTQIQEQTG